MAPQRTFDLDTLKRLLSEHPGWTSSELADALTQDNWANGRDVVVSSHNVTATISRLRLRPPVRRKSDLVATLVKNTGTVIPNALQDQRELRRLRQLDRVRDGLPVGGDDGEADRALAFEAKLIEQRHVIDLYPDGTVFERAAAPWELDADGNLIDIITGYRPPVYDALRHAG